MIRLHLGPGTELMLAERSLGVPALCLGAVAGLTAFFWLRARYGIRSRLGTAGLFAGTMAGGALAVGGIIAVVGRLHPAIGWVCAAFFLIGIVLVSYLGGAHRAGARGAVLPLILRLLAIGVLVVLYFEPTFRLVNRDVHRARLLVMVDNSGSMKVNDGPDKLSRLDWVKSELLGRHGALAALRDDFELDFFSVSDRLDPLDPGRLSALKPDGTSTSFAPTVGDACSRADKLTTIGALLFSDGIDNSGHDPIAAIAQAGLPVFPVAVGTKLREVGDFKDIAVTRVDCERYVPANNKTAVTAYVDAVGLSGRRVSATLRFDGKEQDRQPLVLDNVPGAQTVALAFTPDKKGTFTCSVEVTADPEERLTDNNKKEFDVTVTEPEIKVLLVEGVVRSEYKWLVRSLQMDTNVSLVALVQVRRGTFNQQGTVKDVQLTGFPADYETLAKFNVVIFGDIDRSFLTTAQLRNIQKLVESGGGFLMTGGYSTLGPGGYAGTPIEEILPVALVGKDAGQEKDPFVPRLTADGVQHPIFAGTVPFFATPSGASVQHLPPLMGCTRVGAPKPGASVLAVHPQRTAADGSPLILAAVQHYGKGRTMVFTADTTWRWYLELRGLGRDTPYVKFWGQALRWLAGHKPKEIEEKPGIVAYTDQRYYDPGSTIRIYTQVRDRQGQATDQATVTAMIHGPAGSPAARQIPYLPGSTGKYEADFAPPSPGEYKMLVKAETAEGPLGTAELAFQVGRPNLEFDTLDLNDELLKRLAEQTKGRYTTLVGLSGFLEQLRGAEQARSTTRTVEVWDDDSVRIFGQGVSIPLIIAFALFTALMTAEWVIRRRRQLN